MVRTVINKDALELFLSTVAARRDTGREVALLFKEYLIRSLVIFERHEAPGWPFQPLSSIFRREDEDWGRIEEIVERVVEGGVYRQILVMNYLKWLDCVASGRVFISPEIDPYIPLGEFLSAGASVNREHRFVDVGAAVFELDPELYRAGD